MNNASNSDLDYAPAACQQKGLSAKELFELRSQCKGLVDKWEKDSEAHNYYFAVHSHYDAKNNRCLLRAEITRDYGTEIFLQDAQSNAFLAVCNPLGDKANCAIKDNYDVTHQQVMDYIDAAMRDDR